MNEYDCKRCGIHVQHFVPMEPAEVDYCCVCRFILDIKDPRDRAEAEAWDARTSGRTIPSDTTTKGADNVP